MDFFTILLFILLRHLFIYYLNQQSRMVELRLNSIQGQDKVLYHTT